MSTPGRVRHPGRAVLVLALGLVLGPLAVVIVSAGPAAAHAVMVSASPADRSRVPAPPGQATVTFSERVTLDLGGLTVLDRNGRRVDEGPVTTSNGNATIQVALRPGLPDGTYVTNYQVISGDGHPVTGAIVWGIGAGPLEDLSDLEVAASPGAEALGVAARFVLYLGVLTAAGLAVFARFVHDDGGDRGVIAAATQLAAAIGGVGVLSTIAAQVVLATGRGPGAIADLDNLRKALDGGLGRQSALVLVAMAMLYVSVLVRNRLVGQVLSFYGALACAIAFVFWGHTAASPRPWIAIPADIVHVAAAMVWLGGLVGLVLTLQGRSKLVPDELPADRRRQLLASTIGVVDRFSTTAAASVVVLLVAGMALTLSTTRTLGDALDIGWGRALVGKVAVAAVVVFVAGYNRYRLLPWLLAPEVDVTREEADDTTGQRTSAEPAPDAADADRIPLVSREPAAWRHLIATLRIELLGIALALALTSLLVNLTPDAGASARPFNETQPYDRGTVTLVITPASSRTANAIHVNLASPEGRPVEARAITARLAQPTAGIAPIERPLLNAGGGHFLLENLTEFGVDGTWTVDLVIRSDEFEQQTVTFQVPIS